MLPVFPQNHLSLLIQPVYYVYFHGYKVGHLFIDRFRGLKPSDKKVVTC